MSTVVYQGLPSFLDSQLNESRTLRLKLASPRSHLSHSLEMAISTVLDSDSKNLFRENGDHIKHKFSTTPTEPSSTKHYDGLSFLQTLPSISQTQNERQSVYVHPLVKRGTSVLSDKSLELCTENLGSETGTDIIEDVNNIFSSDSCTRKVHSRKTNIGSCSRRMSSKKTFPPPLSTMMGSEMVQVKPIRENGRLILQAVKVQPRVSCFQADRSNGRLRLRLLDANDSCSSSDSSDNDQGNNNIDPTRDHDSACVNDNNEIENSPDNKLESVTQEEEEYMVRKCQGRCKEGESGNTQGMLLDGSESQWVAS